jgi:hypothetical protein
MGNCLTNDETQSEQQEQPESSKPPEPPNTIYPSVHKRRNDFLIPNTSQEKVPKFSHFDYKYI